ncbi:MAG: serine/threonine protein kinase [Deltaproteobacteria bacterium]|nr:serine/threonine protein kinase [Deltaproteobacteria bacterium]
MRRFKTLTTGTLLDGKYRITGIVGSGGMGTVYRAIYLDIDRQVALKLLHPEMVEDPVVVERFQQEARAAGSIGHDNICEVTKFGTTENGLPYLEMPLLVGLSLAKTIDSNRLSIPRVVDIMCQTLSALQAAHDARIVHRDLKPDNIFITKIGDRDDFVKVLDFGVSKILVQDSVVHLTRSGSMPGTPSYMAPELAKGSKHIDHRADIYAVGVILYEVLTGKKPFSGDSYNEIMFNILTEPFKAPSSLNSAVTADIENVVLTSMARDPSNRYQSADEMRRALLVATGDVKEAETTSPDVTPAKEAPGSNSWNLTDTTPEIRATSPRRSRKQKALVATLIMALIVAISVAAAKLLTTPESPPTQLSVPQTARNQASTKTVSTDNEAIEQLHSPATPNLKTEKKEDSPAKQVEKKKKRRLTKTIPKRKKDEAIEGRSGTTFFTDFD